MAVVLDKPYCTEVEVRAELRNEDTEVQDQVLTAINTASRMIDDWCRTDFWRHDHSSTKLDVPPSWLVGNQVFLPWPIVSITAVEEVSWSDQGVATVTDVESYKYSMEGVVSGARIERYGVLNFTYKPYRDPARVTLRLTGIFGTALAVSDPTTQPPTNLPSTVKRAAVLCAAAISGLFLKVSSNPIDSSRTEVFDSRVPAEVPRLLKRWRINLT